MKKKFYKKKYYSLIFFISLLISQDVFDGYFLFTPGEAFPTNSYTFYTHLMRNDLTDFHSWRHDKAPASMPYIIPGDENGWQNTFLLYPYRVDNPTMLSGGTGGGLLCISWDNDILWSYELSNSDYQHHHDIEPLPNGNVLILSWDRKTFSESMQAGRTSINNPLNEMWSTSIFEIEPNDSGGVNTVWEWHLWDHLIQDENPDADNFGVVADHPELFDINKGNIGWEPWEPSGDWMHCNTISYNPIFDQIVISSRFQNEIFVIDHSTTTEEASGHAGGNSGKGGDFLYRWGNPQNYDRGSNIDQTLSAQHSINWIPESYPGEGNFILYNNGFNKVIEFSPPVDENGNYFIEDNQPYGPISTIWESPFTSSDMQGGSFRLPNGNTLITDCDDSNIKEYTLEGDLVFDYSYTDNMLIARAQKYSINQFGFQENIIGDINQDNFVNIYDLIYIVNIIIEIEPNNILADLNNDDLVDILDVLFLVDIILS